jgi:hypothetical protein
MSGDAKGIHVSKVWGSKAKDFEQLTVDNTEGGIALTASKYSNSQKAVITVETAEIRFRVDGGVPTSTVGHIADEDDQIVLDSAEDIANFRAIRTGSTSATISVSYSS